MNDSSPPLLSVRDLGVSVNEPAGRVDLIEGVCFDVAPGSALGLVGESGSGKSMTLRALLGLAPRQATVRGSVRFGGAELIGCKERELARLRGRQIAMVFQDPTAALNPTQRIGFQVAEGPRLHWGLSRAQARRRAVDLLRMVGLPDAERTARRYPHQLSGGMRQRAVIATALSCSPRLVLCDEPTTALDVTIQAQILRLLKQACEDVGAAMVFVSHDLTVIRQICQQVAVMYAGRIVETGPVDAVFRDPRHGYTASLLHALPDLDKPGPPRPIAGEPPNPRHQPTGCRFHPRCPYVEPRCAERAHELIRIGSNHQSACLHAAKGLPVRTGAEYQLDGASQ